MRCRFTAVAEPIAVVELLFNEMFRAWLAVFQLVTIARHAQPIAIVRLFRPDSGFYQWAFAVHALGCELCLRSFDTMPQDVRVTGIASPHAGCLFLFAAAANFRGAFLFLDRPILASSPSVPIASDAQPFDVRSLTGSMAPAV